ncbi:zinc ribbon domain-containing protein [Polyangium aurulentum]|uniref:zinc ribbon domain-containing protein n=1 Tax=Polyangium aurulentum TaxID=2567896 RepID=UPI0010AE7F70|nr:zinc ribbon domain-containing protein [Polyangium aurulentum]UQA61465.1 zinc ribbon domain-containing protein [Polyangium aurulentum]
MSAEEKRGRDRRDDELERQIARYMKIGLPAVVVTGAIVAGVLVDVSTAILVLAAGALLGVIATFWASLRTLLGETPLSGADAYAIGAPPRAEEEQKRAVIRALKDLEFEHDVGKISDEDYQTLVTKYRAEAKRLLRLLDEDAAPRRERAEALVMRRLRREGLLDDEPVKEDADEDATDGAPDAEPEAEAKEPVEAPKKKTKKKGKKARKAAATPADAQGRACPACATVNDVDAVFCKKCGARVAEAVEAEPEAQAKADEEAGA